MTIDLGKITVKVTGDITVRFDGSITPPPPPDPHLVGLPARIAGLYHPTWATHPAMAIPDTVNTVYLAFATPDLDGPPGAVTLPVADFAALRDEVAAVRARGTAVVLSVGGAGVAVPVTTPTEAAAFTASIEGLHDVVGPFDGVDLDLEHPIDVDTLAGAALELHARLGVDVSASSSGDNAQYKALAQQVTAGGHPLVLAIQYYDYPTPNAAHVVSRTGQLIDSYGLAPDQVVVGVRHVGDLTSTWSAGGLVDMWATVASMWPGLRGMVSWDSILDRDTQLAGVPGFAGVVAPFVTASI